MHQSEPVIPALALVPPPIADGLTQDEVMSTNKSMIWGIRMIAQIQLSEPNALDRTLDIGVRYLNHYVDDATKKLIEDKKLTEKDARLVSRFGEGVTPELVARGVIMAARLLASDLERDFDDPNSGLMLQLQDMIDHHPTAPEEGVADATGEFSDDEEGKEEVPAEAAPAEAAGEASTDPDAPSAV